MASFKTPNFNERSAAARAAKQKALDMLRAKPAPDPAVIAERQAAHAAREAAAANRRTARELAASETRAAKSAGSARELEDGEVESSPPGRRPPSDAELKSARDARYAARKARKR